MRRDLLRIGQEWKRRLGALFPQSSSTSRPPQEQTAWQHLQRARWWILPVVVGCFSMFACWQLLQTTASTAAPHTPILFDAPLPDPLRIRWSSRQQGLYFELKHDARDNRLLARHPAPGTRAFRGQDVVPIFGEQIRFAEMYIPPCQNPIAPESTVFYTHDGLILWPCSDPQEEGKILLYRIGWRFHQKKWRGMVTLGRSAAHDIVLGSALLPLHSLSLSLQQGQLFVTNAENKSQLPASQRLLCLERAEHHPSSSSESVTEESTDQIQANTSAKVTTKTINSQKNPQPSASQDTSNRTKTATKTTTTSDPIQTGDSPDPLPSEDPKTPSCKHEPLQLVTGQRFRVFSKHHPDKAVTLLWQVSSQERDHYDLLVEPVMGAGSSVRHWRTTPGEEQDTYYAVGNALLSFGKHLPDAVRTLDLDDQVHELILRKILVYLSPAELSAYLRRTAQHAPLDLEKVAQDAPLVSLQPYLKPLYHNPYLRNRLWMANQALAQRYRQQARALFRIQSGTSGRPEELVGLGLGGATLQAPQRNLLKWGTVHRSRPVDIRLRTVLTAHQPGTSYVTSLNEQGQAQHQSVHFVDTQPLELLNAPSLPETWVDRDWRTVSTTSRARSLLWIGNTLYQSQHIVAYRPTQTAPQQTTPQDPKKPERFLYRVSERWWKRTPGLQRSSDFWPIRELAAHLGNLLTQDKLAQALKDGNPKRWKLQKHCGNESRQEGRRWVHRSKCWGMVEGFAGETDVIVPCNDLVKSRLRENYCRPGQTTPQIDSTGQVVRTAVPSLEGQYGAVILPPTEVSTITTTFSPTDKAGKSHQTQTPMPHTVRHVIRMLPGSGPVLLDGQPMDAKMAYVLRPGTLIELGTQKLRYISPDGTLALAQFRREYIVPHYPEGPVFAHAIAGSMGGPFRTSPQELQRQLPPPAKTSSVGTNPQSGAKPQAKKVRKIATSLQPDIQRTAFAVTRQHLARMDSPEFQKQFRRRYIRNPHKPHAGAVVILDRSNGRILASLSFPAVDPNLPPEQDNDSTKTMHQYLQGQIVDRFGITDGLIAYDPLKLPPLQPTKGKITGRPSPIPHYLEAIEWDAEETQKNISPDSRSGWLQERVLRGGQTPGSTAKIITALAYARYLRQQGKAVRFPAHHCHGGMMFMRERKSSQGPSSWQSSTLRFRCHKREGHGTLTLQQALAVSCNVYFAKLALEMAGASPPSLRRQQVQWIKNRHGGSGKYQSIYIPRNTFSEAMREKPIHRTLFQTAAQLGFTMRYQYRIPAKPAVNPKTSTGSGRKKRVPRVPDTIGRYTDVYWDASQPAWSRSNLSLPSQEQRRQHEQQIRQRLERFLPQGSFGLGVFFGYSSAYPAWQQWVHGAQDPRYGYASAVQQTFGSTDASLRAMAYIGFGQNFIASPLQLAQVTGAVAQGGWLHFPRFWIGDWDESAPSPQQDVVSRPAPVRIAHAEDAKLLQQAMAAVTNAGTASRPFRNLNQTCLKHYGLQIVGKTGTAETSNQRSRERLRQQVRQAGRMYWHGGSRAAWIKQTGCHYRRFWQYDEPEENVADSLFVGTFLSTQPTSANNETPVPRSNSQTWDIRNLAFAVVVKNGYHPEGAPCVGIRNKRTVDLDRTEAKYLAHDIMSALLQSQGMCPAYQDAASLQPTQPFADLLKKPRRKQKTSRVRRKQTKQTKQTKQIKRRIRKKRPIRKETRQSKRPRKRRN